MSYVKGSQLPATSTVADTDTLIVTQEGDSKATKKATKSDLLKEDRTRLTNLEIDNTTNKNNITNLQNDKAEKNHNHAISDITNLQSALDGKAASNHSHSYLPLSGGNLTGDLILNGASEQHVTFNNCSKSKLQTYFYKGNSTDSTTILGLWDPTNKEPIWKVNNDWTFEIGKQTTFWKNAIFNNAELTFSNGKGIYGKDSKGVAQRFVVIGADDCCYLGGVNLHTYIRSSDCPQYLDSSGIKYNIYHSGNFNPSDYAPKVYESTVLYGSLSSKFRTWLIGSNKVGGFAIPFRKDDSKDSSMPQFGAGIAWGQGDTNGMLCVDYINPKAYIAGGNGDKLVWSKQIAWKDDLITILFERNNGTINKNINTCFNSSSGNFTAPEAGQYLVMCSGHELSSSSSEYVACVLGGSSSNQNKLYTTGSSGFTLITLNEGQTLAIYTATAGNMNKTCISSNSTVNMLIARIK